MWCETDELMLGTVGDAMIMITGVVLIVMLRRNYIADLAGREARIVHARMILMVVTELLLHSSCCASCSLRGQLLGHKR